MRPAPWVQKLEWIPRKFCHWQHLQLTYYRGIVTFERHCMCPPMYPIGVKEVGQLHLRDLPTIWDMAQNPGAQHITIPFHRGAVFQSLLTSFVIRELHLPLDEPASIRTWLTEKVGFCIRMVKVYQRRQAIQLQIPDLVVP